MPDSRLEDYCDTPDARAELVEFLTRTGAPTGSRCTWQQRLAHLWDENPHSDLHPRRGYVVRRPQGIVGYGGAVPTAYALSGKTVPALLATTLRIQPGHEPHGARLLIRMREIARDTPVIHTTPVPKLQTLLHDMEARLETSVTRRLYPAGIATGLPRLPVGLRIVTDLREVRCIAPVQRWSPVLEKQVSLAGLRWQLSTPMYDFRLLAAVDEGGALQAFLILQAGVRVFRLFRAWEVLESWSASGTPGLPQALLGELIRQPDLPGPAHRWVTTTSFIHDDTWDDTPSLLHRCQQVHHCFMMPASLRHVPKRSVMAEGDLVL